MKRYIKYILNGVGGTAATVLLWSCSAESPFENESTGTVQLHTVVNQLTTRATTPETSNETGYTQADLEDNCIVSISRKNGTITNDSTTSDGLVYQARGLSNVKNAITLRTGHYVAEAQTGDSVSADFDKKYFKSYEEFDVTANSISHVTLNCKIQNSVVCINSTTVKGETETEATGEGSPSNPTLDELMRDYKITVTGSNNAQLKFTQANITSKGYFMMADGDTELNYTIEGYRKNTTGTDGYFKREGKITGVKRSWQYTINIVYNPPVSTDGHFDTSFINIDIQDGEVVAEKTESLESYNPTIKGIGFDFTDGAGEWTYTSENSIPDILAVQVCAAGNGFKSATLKIDNGEPQSLAGISTEGISWTWQYDETSNLTVAYLKFTKSYISGLSSGSHTFKISVTDNTVSATDSDGKESTATLTINR